MKLEIVTGMPSVVLRPLQVQDADELFLLVNQNRERLRAWLPWLDEAKTQTDQVTFIQRCSECALKGTEFHYAILVGGDIAGMVSFHHIDKRNRSATIGYWLAKSMTGQGIMTAAVKALIAEGFEDLELNRIQARVETSNDPSQAVCERAGFKKEGVLREAEWLYDHCVDITMNAVLKSEWRK
jgi:ribosomal-protein-serine acetyltransferase